jgi:tRNA A37 threonylcarbamoyladenosine synthetase subunit TsaC/SUA5/YrdC
MAKNFWPGPLTMVMKADDSKIAPCITANTGFVGVRWPENLIA